MYENFTIGLDLSHYDYYVDFKAIKNAGAGFVILKGGGCEDRGGEIYDDPTFSVRVQEAYDTGFRIIGSYYFASPGYWLKRQYTMPSVENLPDDKHPLLQHFLKIYKNKAIDFVAFDFEDASKTQQSTGIWMRFWLSDMVERIRRQQAKGNLRPFKLGVYTRRTWIDANSPEMDIWLGTQPDMFIWCANWARGQLTVKPIAEILRSRPVQGHMPRSFGWSDKRDKTWHIWQWAGDDPNSYGFKCNDAILTSTKGPRPVDLDLFNGTYEQMLAWVGKAEQSQQQPGTNEQQTVDLSEITSRLDEIKKKVDEIRLHFS